MEPRLDLLLAKKVNPHAIRKKERKEPAFKKERNIKIKPSNIQSSMMKQSKKTVPEVQGKPEDNASSLFRFAKEKFGVELNLEQDRKPAGLLLNLVGKVLLSEVQQEEVTQNSWIVTVWTLYQ